ncbi:MAG TPA: penicillin-binding transpeptidase domain-containing protein [Thermotogota bacterium]|nr:penicillin-binding transpeptidase domain-containing protein [Thermotogota bacterium]HRW91695.1 penicillin-binding transpeptidase domain-containing protein [Thermotogota bacterium]
MIEKRVRIVTTFFLLFILVLLGRSFFLSLQPVSPAGQRTGLYKVYPQRGIIYDAMGVPLVNNAHQYIYYFDSGYFQRQLDLERVDPDVVLSQVHSFFGYDPQELQQKRQSMPFVPVGKTSQPREDIPSPLSLFISVDHSNIRGILYPEMQQIIGKVDSFGSGVNGLEHKWDTILAPKGEGTLSFGVKGDWLLLGDHVDFIPAQNGQDLNLSVDLRFQQLLKNALEEGLEKYHAESALGIIMEAKTGKIRAMYSTLPYNDAIMGLYEPGSALKPFIFALALKYDLHDLDRIFSCTGKIRPFSDLPTVIGDTHVHGDIDLDTALAESCNVATVELAKQFLEEQDDWTYFRELRLLGFGSKSGIELPDEINGILHVPPDWNRLTGVQMAIGQGIGVTGIQLVSAINTLANDGVYISPTILRDRTTPAQTRTLYSQDVVQRVRAMMQQVVDSGTGISAQVPGISIGGKTGTAQKAEAGIGYVQGKYVSSFVGFFPVEDPIYTVLISVDEPEGDVYYGGDVAAPIFQKVVKQILAIVNQPQDPEPKPIVVKTWTLPDFHGFSRKDVLDILRVHPMGTENIRFRGEGVVVQQDPLPNTPIEDVTQLVLTLSNEGDFDVP